MKRTTEVSGNQTPEACSLSSSVSMHQARASPIPAYMRPCRSTRNFLTVLRNFWHSISTKKTYRRFWGCSKFGQYSLRLGIFFHQDLRWSYAKLAAYGCRSNWIYMLSGNSLHLDDCSQDCTGSMCWQCGYSWMNRRNPETLPGCTLPCSTLPRVKWQELAPIFGIAQYFQTRWKKTMSILVNCSQLFSFIKRPPTAEITKWSKSKQLSQGYFLVVHSILTPSVKKLFDWTWSTNSRYCLYGRRKRSQNALWWSFSSL